MNHQYDCLVIGAGLAGSVAARELAERGGKRVLVLERRNHVGGNAYDCFDEAGVLIHQYGPHIFHTNDEAVFRYLCRFTRWRDYQHRVVADLPAPDGGRMQMPVPFNLTSLRKAFGPEEGKRLGEKLIAAYGAEKKVTILELRQNQDPELAKVADYVYEHVFVHYTMKQWGQTPDQIDPNTTARVPVFLSEDDRYFQDEYQGMPLKGYTPLFEAMLDHPNITVVEGEVLDVPEVANLTKLGNLDWVNFDTTEYTQFNHKNTQTPAISNITLVRAIKFIGPTLTSIFGALEPLTAVAIGATVFGERFGWTSALGVGLVVAAVSIVVLDTQRKTGKTTPSSST